MGAFAGEVRRQIRRDKIGRVAINDAAKIKTDDVSVFGWSTFAGCARSDRNGAVRQNRTVMSEFGYVLCGGRSMPGERGSRHPTWKLRR